MLDYLIYVYIYLCLLISINCSLFYACHPI